MIDARLLTYYVHSLCFEARKSAPIVPFIREFWLPKIKDPNRTKPATLLFLAKFFYLLLSFLSLKLQHFGILASCSFRTVVILGNAQKLKRALHFLNKRRIPLGVSITSAVFPVTVYLLWAAETTVGFGCSVKCKFINVT